MEKTAPVAVPQEGSEEANPFLAVRSDRCVGARVADTGTLTVQEGDSIPPSYRRSPFERDVDRILKSPSFLRLERVAQVTHATDPLRAHSRYSHSVEVANLSRRIAARLLKQFGSEQEFTKKSSLRDHLNLDVVEAAGLAHDLGHPPFAHSGEKALRELLDDANVRDGFEGNAQTFRILVRLDRHHDAPYGGLGLTRATLRAVQKYPHERLSDPSLEKFGAYEDDSRALDWVREYGPEGPRQMSIEAAIMDWADDIAYAIHDFEDYYRAGLIRMEVIQLRALVQEADTFLELARTYREDILKSLLDKFPADESKRKLDMLGAKDSDRLANLLADVVNDDQPVPKGKALEIAANFPPKKPYEDDDRLNAEIARWRSKQVKNLIEATGVTATEDGNPELTKSKEAEDIVKALKDFTRSSVIKTPMMQSIESGHRSIINSLFRPLAGVKPRGYTKEHTDWVISTVPPWAKALYKEIAHGRMGKAERHRWCRTTADYICSLSDAEAIRQAERLAGSRLGSVADRFV